MRLLLRDGDEIIETRTFDSTVITVGSGEHDDLRIPDRRIIAQQLTLRANADGSWVAQPAEGGSPMVLNGRPFTKPTVIKHADDVAFDNYTLVVNRSQFAPMNDVSAGIDNPRKQAKTRAIPLPPGSLTRSASEPIELSQHAPQLLAKFAQDLPRTSDMDAWLDFLVDWLPKHFDGRFAFVGIRHAGEGPLEHIRGAKEKRASSESPPFLLAFIYRCLERSQAVCVLSSSLPGVGSAIVAPITGESGPIGLVYVDRKPEQSPFSEFDRDLLSVMASLIGGSIGVAKEVVAAAPPESGTNLNVMQVQASLLPRNVPQWDELQIAVFFNPGLEPGKNLYDIMSLSNGVVAILVADVAADVLRRATALAEVRTAFRSAALHLDAPHTFLRAVNWMLCDHYSTCQLHAAALAIHPLTGELQIATAGQVGAMIIDTRGDSRDLANHQSPAAGQQPGIPFEAQLERLACGDSLALFTRGAWVAQNDTGQTLGEVQLTESIRDGFGQRASVALDDLVQEHESYLRRQLQNDDITLIMIQRTEAGG